MRMTMPFPLPLPFLAALGLLLAAAPGWAQYKVVGPDGRVTYTDRPVVSAPGSQVLPVRRDAIAPAREQALPIELRALTSRFPVTLYTSNDCPPCVQARKLLLQRGVPYTERTVSSEEDITALQRVSGGRIVPSLTVGSQALRGLMESAWLGTLDLAGYPTESRLPRGWAPVPATPLVARPPDTEAATTRAPEPPAEPVPAPAGTGGIRF